MRQDEVAFGLLSVMKLKDMYGRKVRGIERSTFVLDGKGCSRANGAG
jgi:thioredoxin-dependent peroxiredoxin